MKNLVVLVFFFLQLSVFCQSNSLKLSKIDSYFDWNWQAYIIENGLITSAIVPSMGASLMQYDFGTDTFLITNPATYGHSYTAGQIQSPFNGDWGFGGFEVWSAPEAWPPSPVLTYCQYDDSLIFVSADSLQLQFKSGIEVTGFPGIQYEKTYTAYKNSTLIKFQHTLINKGSTPIKIGTMNVAEVQTQHSGQNDYSNFKAYFPIRKNSIFGKQCVRITPVSPAFQGEVSPGVYGVEYINTRGKVFADSPEGWMAFVDERDTQTYAFLYDVFDGEEYPDQGANTEVYVENNLAFMAFEAISPLVNIEPISDTLRFTEYFASARLNGIIKKVNQAGAAAERLTYDSLNQKLTGRFGVFAKSTLQLLYCDTLDNILEEGTIYSASPDTTFGLNEEIILPVGTQLIKLRAFDLQGKIIGDLDEDDFTEEEFVSTLNSENINFRGGNSGFNAWMQRNDILNIEINIQVYEPLTLELYKSDGSKIKVFNLNNISLDKTVNQFSIEPLTKGIYFIRLSGNSRALTKKLLVL